MTVNKEDVLKAVSNVQVKVEMSNSHDIVYIIRKTTEAILNAVIAAIEAVNEPDPQNNREMLLQVLSELDDNELARVMCISTRCSKCPAGDACRSGGAVTVAEWLKKEGATVEQFKDAFE